MSGSEEVIDLTDSIIVYPCDKNDVMIVLDSDDSICSPAFNKRRNNNKRQNRKKSSSTDEKISGPEQSRSKKWDDCPICLDELGKRPLASTKCGHVFCLKCLENSLHSQNISKKCCPTCRRVLKGTSAYHPLYINYS